MDDFGSMLSSVLSDPESMQQIKELADMMGNGGSSEGADSSSSDTSGGGLDIGMLMNVARLFSEADDSSDKNRALLLALKPHLSEERQERVDKAVKLLKLYSIFITLRDSGMLNNLGNLL